MKEIIHACLLQAKEAGKLVPPDLRDEEDLVRRYFDLEQDLDATATAQPRRGTQRAAEPAVDTVPSV